MTTGIPADVRCVGYVRVSTDRQAGEVHTSLADQERAIVERARGLKLAVGRWYRDEGFSGASVEARPAFRQLLADCAASRRTPRAPGYVVVLNDSRFGRFPDPEEAAYWRVHLAKLGWLVRFAEGDQSEDTTARTLMRAIGSTTATAYRESIRANAKRGAKGAMSQGFWCREAPLGYRRRVVYPPEAARVLELGVLKAPNEKVRLTPHESEAADVRWMFEAYASGTETLTSLARAMAAKYPDRRWGPQSVAVMLKNPAYVGDVVGGRRPADKHERALHRVRPREEWYGLRDAHPAIVSRELFAVVAARLQTNKALTRAAAGDYVLTGLVTCTHCGRHYAGGGGGRARFTRYGERGRFYKCTGAALVPAICPGKVGTVTRGVLEDAVIGTLAAEIGRASRRRLLLEEIDRAFDAVERAAARDTAPVRATRAKLEQRRARLVAALADGTLTREEAAPQLETVRAELARLESTEQAARFAQQRRRISAAERERLRQLVLDFPVQVRRLTGVALRELIRPWLAAATFDKESRLLTLDIRRVPLMSVTNLAVMPGHDSRKGARRGLIRRRISLAQPRPGRQIAAGGAR